VDMRGRPDLYGHALRITQTGFADQIAAAAALIMGEADEAQPVALVRGLTIAGTPLPASQLIRAAQEDLFR
jgi:coenzyme F420-0:L-glutamate ligase/coenzyme F420-1:gamma-L-glutamate ligase